MQYLSVHDLVWINATATGETLSFEFDRLEAAMAAQYGYGNSTNVTAQSSNLLSTMLGEPIFDHGNRRTAFISVATFLFANGYKLVVSDAEAAEMINQVSTGRLDSQLAISKLAHKSETALPDGIALRSLVTHLFNTHSDAISALSVND